MKAAACQEKDWGGDGEITVFEGRRRLVPSLRDNSRFRLKSEPAEQDSDNRLCNHAHMQNRSFIYRSFGPPVERLALETVDMVPVNPTQLRVAMSFVPVNPSDLIPITGAYTHRIELPAIAGYEGVGRVISAPPTHSALLGRRVLPLRGAGTWQAYVDCDPDLAVPVPDSVGDLAAARAYINPLAALTMLHRWPIAGKRLLLSGAGSTCAELLASWAKEQGAAKIRGIYRSESRIERLLSSGIEPVSMHDLQGIRKAAASADLVFDSLGGPIGSLVLDEMRKGSAFIGYGLLSGQGIRPSSSIRAGYYRFHLRDSLAGMTAESWQRQFLRLWPKLNEDHLPPVQVFPFHDWRRALEQAAKPGGAKPMLHFEPME